MKNLFRAVVLAVLAIAAAQCGAARRGAVTDKADVYESQRIKAGNKTKIEVSLDEQAPIRLMPTQLNVKTAKPVIYLYPERETEVAVAVDFDGEFQFTYPDYGDGWRVIASPDGSLVNKADGKHYSYLYWDGLSYPTQGAAYETGYVVDRDGTVAFLQDILPRFGLLPREYNEFIVYWTPLLQRNKWNFIHFRSGGGYDAISRNRVVPRPQTEIRVFMDFAGVDRPFEVAPQKPVAPPRHGFTLVEWGGRELTHRVRVKTADGTVIDAGRK